MKCRIIKIINIIMALLIVILLSIDRENEIETYTKVRTDILDYKIKKVALTFDDGPDGEYTEKLLDGLKERNVKATFFVTGINIVENERLIQRMAEDGHLIGNHTYTHSNLEQMSFERACEEINDTNSYIENLTKKKVKYIRPPYGAFNDKLKEETDMAIVMWNVDPLDWKEQNAKVIASRIEKQVKSGDIILLHDIYESSVDAALLVIDELKEQGYIFVTVDEMKQSDKIIR